MYTNTEMMELMYFLNCDISDSVSWEKGLHKEAMVKDEAGQ